MSSIAAGTTSGTALVSTGDTTGALVLKTGSSAITALTIDTLQNVGIGTTPVTWSTQVEALQIGPHAAYYSNTVDTTTVVSNNLYVSAGGSNTYSNTGAVAQFYQVNGQHVWRSAASGTAGTTVALTQVLAVEKDRSLALQGATTQTGAGISFPATQVASSDANTLDDYEEGTWTPNIDNGWNTSNSVTYTAQNGSYTKIGRVVVAAFHIQINTWSGNAGPVFFGGFPFTVATTTDSRFQGTVYHSGPNTPASTVSVTLGYAKLDNSSYYPVFSCSRDDLAIANSGTLLGGDFSAGDIIAGTFTYFTT